MTRALAIAALLVATAAPAVTLQVVFAPVPGVTSYRVNVRQVPTPWALTPLFAVTPTVGPGTVGVNFSVTAADDSTIEAAVTGYNPQQTSAMGNVLSLRRRTKTPPRTSTATVTATRTASATATKTAAGPTPLPTVALLLLQELP